MRGVAMLGMLVATAAGAAEVGTNAQAPEAQARKTFVGLSVLPGVLTTRVGLGVEAERALGERLSVRLGVRAGAAWDSQETNGFSTHSRDFHLGAEPGVRFFLTGRAPAGLWVGPNLELRRSWRSVEFQSVSLPGGEVSTVSTDGSAWSLGLAGLVGYSMVLREGLTVQAGVGFGATRVWQRFTGFGAVGGVLSSEKQQMQVGSTPKENHATAWAFSERVSLAVGWAF